MELTETETFIMERIVQGVTYDKIASEINVSRRSIDNYLRKIYVKLDVSSRALLNAMPYMRDRPRRYPDNRSSLIKVQDLNQEAGPIVIFGAQQE